jgi:hypothetical protein
MTMIELLSRFEPGELIGLVAVTGGLLCGIFCGTAAIVGDYWLRIRRLALKQDMLNRGMSADEIHSVLTAGSKRSAKECSSAYS